jgi:dienelactone hydrolase
LHAVLAAALEPGFQFVVAVGGTTTYEALIAANAAGHREDGPSAYVAGILHFTDMDRVAACLAPRPVLIAGNASGGGNWPVRGYMRVLRTMRTVYGLYDAADRVHKVAGEQADDMTPYLPDITQWLREQIDAAAESPENTVVDPIVAAAAPGDADAELDFNMLRYMQGRIADRSASLPTEPKSRTDWQTYRQETVGWLRAQCDVDSMQPPADAVVTTSEADGLLTEQIALGVDDEFRCPAVLVRPAAADATRRPAIVLSHDDRQCAASAKIAEAARALASNGCWVIVPEHASVHPQSLQGLADPQRPHFYGDQAGSLYGPADAVGLSPIALRVAENLAAFRYLTAQAEVNPERIVLAGIGIGGVDASLAAMLDERVAGVAAINVTTMRDWSVNVAPDELHFFHIMPYLPSLLARGDLDLMYGALAPRPLLVVRLKDGWPRSGFDQVATTATAIYKLQQAGGAVLALGPRDVTEELEAALPDGVQRQLVATARNLVPAPPQAGIVGNTDGLRPRRSVDSAAGLIWIVGEMDGYDQELAGAGYRLQTWSFFNDNGDAQSGRAITPLLFQTEGDKYQLIGIGTTRTNAGIGVQTFAFEPVEGTDTVSDGCVFGWHTGDGQGKTNPGVVEYEDASDAQMVILTGDGEMTGQKLQLGNTYRLQSQYPRRYSVMAVCSPVSTPK